MAGTPRKPVAFSPGLRERRPTSRFCQAFCVIQGWGRPGTLARIE